MLIVEQSVLDGIRKGSFCERHDRIVEALKAAEMPTAVLAVHEDRVYCEGDKSIMEYEYTVDESGQIVFGESFEVPGHNDDTVGQFVEESLGAAVVDMLGGRDPGPRLMAVVRFVPDRPIMTPDAAVTLLGEQFERDDWRRQYRTGKPAIHGALRGQIARISSKVPARRFGKLKPTELSECAGMLGESLTALSAAAHKVVDNIGEDVVTFESSDRLFAGLIGQMLDEAKTIKMVSAKAAASGWTGGQLAEMHDKMAARVSEMLIVCEWLKAERAN